MSRLPGDFMAPEAFVGLVRSLALVSHCHGAGVDRSTGVANASRDPHLGLSWFSLLAETAMPRGIKLALLPCGNAWLPMMSRQEATGCLEGMANFYTPLYGLVNGDAVDQVAMERLFRSWRSVKGPNELRFAPMDPHGKDFQCLSSCLRKAGWWVSDYFCFGNWYHPVISGGWHAYLAGRPGHVRNTITRAERKLARAGVCNIDIIQHPGAALEGAIKAFVDVYGKSWKAQEPFPDFIPALCRMAADQGILRLGVLRLNQQPIAAQLWLVAYGTAYIVKLAYDPAFAHFSPGTVMTASMFRRVIDEDQVLCIDYLIGDDAYKADWMTERRERWGVVAFNMKKLRGISGAVRHALGKLLS